MRVPPTRARYELDGYELADRHFSSGRAAEIAAGADADRLVTNAIFRPAPGGA